MRDFADLVITLQMHQNGTKWHHIFLKNLYPTRKWDSHTRFYINNSVIFSINTTLLFLSEMGYTSFWWAKKMENTLPFLNCSFWTRLIKFGGAVKRVNFRMFNVVLLNEVCFGVFLAYLVYSVSLWIYTPIELVTCLHSEITGAAGPYDPTIQTIPAL